MSKNKFWKSIVLVLLGMLLMLTNAIGAEVSAVDATREVTIPSKVTIDGEKYTTIKPKGGKLYPGKYALSTDITLTNRLQVIKGTGNGEPTIIDLNGYILTGPAGSNDATITVCEGATLIIRDNDGSGKISGCEIAVSVIDGILTIENAELSENACCAIDAYSSEVNVEGNSRLFDNGNDAGGLGAIYAEESTVFLSGGEISGNSCGICCGEAVTLTASGNVVISDNETGIYLASDTSFSMGNGLIVSENSNSGIVCSEDQIIGILSEYDDSINTLAEITLIDDAGNIKDARMTLPLIFKAYKQCFTGCGSVVSAVAGDNGSSYAVVQTMDCTGHQYTFTADGYNILGHCDVCGFDSKISLVSSAYFDSQSSSYFVNDNSVDKDIYIDLDSWDDYKVIVYPKIVYKNLETGESGFDVPTSYGTYTAKLAIFQDEIDVSSSLCETAEMPFTTMCSRHQWEYISDGASLNARCQECGGILAKARLGLTNYDLSEFGSEDIVLYNCQGDEFISDITYVGNKTGLGTFAIVYGYYQEDGSVKYSFTAPDDDGKYNVRISVLKRPSNPNSAIASTDAFEFTYRHHNWEYSAEDASICAHCDKCNDSASVCLDNSEVLTAARNYADNGSGTFSGNVFHVNGWSSKEGIKKYHILYKNNNDESYTMDRSILDQASFNCTAKIILLEDENDINSSFLESSEKSFYFATIPGDSISVESFDVTSMKVPDSGIDSGRTVYYVSSVEELYWAANNALSNEIISITNDIVVNPMVLSSDSESIYSASDTVYNWVGFGSSEYFSGTILGNGHIIYGLYSDYQSAGLIAYGSDFVVKDLTIKDSVFIGNQAGGIAGRGQAFSINSETLIDSCQVLNSCFIRQTGNILSNAGGIMGYFGIDTESYSLIIKNCVSNTYIDASGLAGGIIGACYVDSSSDGNTQEDDYDIHFENCVNLGSVYAHEAAGGIVGAQNGTLCYAITLDNCRNSGRIESIAAAGGLVGLAHNNKNAGFMKEYVNNSVNLGEIYCNGTGAGGLLGIGDYEKQKGLICVNNAYYGAVHALGAAYAYNDNTKYYITDDSVGTITSDADGNIKLTRELARKANLCNGFTLDSGGNATIANDLYEHVAAEWQTDKCADCINGGERVQKCLLCGEIISTGYSNAHGHDYSDGTCIYCGEADRSNLGSVFSTAVGGLYIMCALVAVFAGTVIIVSKVKKKNGRTIRVSMKKSLGE